MSFGLECAVDCGLGYHGGSVQGFFKNLIWFFTFRSSFYLLCFAHTHACSVTGKGGGSDQGTGTAISQHCEGKYCAFLFFYPTSPPVVWVTRHMVRLSWFRRLKSVAEAQGYIRQTCCPERLCLFLCFAHQIVILYIDSSLRPKELIC